MLLRRSQSKSPRVLPLLHSFLVDGNIEMSSRKRCRGWPGTDTMSAEPIVMEVDAREDEDERTT